MGQKPSEAAENALRRITRFYPNFSGAVITADKKGRYGAACHNLSDKGNRFVYCVGNQQSVETFLASVDCI